MTASSNVAVTYGAALVTFAPGEVSFNETFPDVNVASFIVVSDVNTMFLVLVNLQSVL